jgi:hypothetical protein
MTDDREPTGLYGTYQQQIVFLTSTAEGCCDYLQADLRDGGAAARPVTDFYGGMASKLARRRRAAPASRCLARRRPRAILISGGRPRGCARNSADGS